MCRHFFNLHTCGHYTPNPDHTLTHHCTAVQRALYNYHAQSTLPQPLPPPLPSSTTNTTPNTASLPASTTNPPTTAPTATAPPTWPLPPPTPCPIVYPTPAHPPPLRTWVSESEEAKIRGWNAFPTSEVTNFLRTHHTRNRQYRLRRFAKSVSAPVPTTVRLVAVPWGCGMGTGECDRGLQGGRRMYSELGRFRGFVGRGNGVDPTTVGTGRVEAPWFHEGEVEVALVEEGRVRFLEDVEALMAGGAEGGNSGMGPVIGGGIPAFPTLADYERRRALEGMVIRWEVVGGEGQGGRRRWCEVWGGADVRGRIVSLVGGGVEGGDGGEGGSEGDGGNRMLEWRDDGLGAGPGGDHSQQGGGNDNDDAQAESSAMGAARYYAQDDSNILYPGEPSAEFSSGIQNRGYQPTTTYRPSLQNPSHQISPLPHDTTSADILSLFLSRSRQPPPPSFYAQHTPSSHPIAESLPHTPSLAPNTLTSPIIPHNTPSSPPPPQYPILTPSPLPSTPSIPIPLPHRTPNPRHGTATDTDIATLLTYPPARYGVCPLHTSCGRPIVDGSAEYWANVERVAGVWE